MDVLLHGTVQLTTRRREVARREIYGVVLRACSVDSVALLYSPLEISENHHTLFQPTLTKIARTA